MCGVPPGARTCLAWHAASAGRLLRSRSGWVLAGVEAFFAATMLLRLVAMTMSWTETHGLGESWDFGLMVAGGLAAALYGNLGDLGLVLDRTSEAARVAREAQLADTLQREALAHRGPAAVVRLDVDERDDPPALLLQVHDDGPFWLSAGASGGSASLQVAQRVMAAHGGTLRLASTQTGGITATLELPQPG